jgi:hypothetical protein
MSLTAIEAVPEIGHNEAACLICSTGRHPDAAYRPHTLGPDCWCCIGANMERARETCWIPKYYPAIE